LNAIPERCTETLKHSKFWVMSWGSKALVLEPESLKDEIRQELETMLAEYIRDSARLEGSLGT
jgi:hypothetical protein